MVAVEVEDEDEVVVVKTSLLVIVGFVDTAAGWTMVMFGESAVSVDFTDEGESKTNGSNPEFTGPLRNPSPVSLFTFSGTAKAAGIRSCSARIGFRRVNPIMMSTIL